MILFLYIVIFIYLFFIFYHSLDDLSQFLPDFILSNLGFSLIMSHGNYYNLWFSWHWNQFMWQITSQGTWLGLTLHEYEKNINNNPEKDKEFDQKIEKLGQEKDNLVIDSRLAWYFIPRSIKIKFNCSDEVRLKRICDRDNVSQEDAQYKTFFRETSHMNRYTQTYGLADYTTDAHFDFIIDTNSLTPEEIVEEILKKINK